VTVTVIAALASFDIVYISTQGGPGNATMVPGLEIYYLAFSEREVGMASALAVALVVLVLACVIPLQRLTRDGPMIVNRREAWTGRVLLVLLMAITVAAVLQPVRHRAAPSGTYPTGLTGRTTRNGGTSPMPSARAHGDAADVERAHRARRRTDLASAVARWPASPSAPAHARPSPVFCPSCSA
jgi:hypothetical protein